MAEDEAPMQTSMSVPLCRISPVPVVRSVVEAGTGAGAVAQDVCTAIVRGEVEAGADSEDASDPQSQQKVRACRFFLNGSNCRFGGCCRFLHSWWCGAEDFSLPVSLQGHRKPITGIILTSDSRSLFSSSLDKVKIWDLESAQCIRTVTPGSRIRCILGKGTWTFLGVPGAVEVWNWQTSADFFLDFPGGRQVYALEMGSVNGDSLIFAGISNGSIFAWKYNITGNTFEAVTGAMSMSLLFAHRSAIRVLVALDHCLYSASMDSTIKVWDLTTLQCFQTLTDHKDAVTSIFFWDRYMLSGSLDCTVRVWSANLDRQFKSIYTHEEEDRIVALGGMCDPRCKPVLMCSCDDFSIHFYDLPSFAERGRIFSGDEIRHIAIGQDGLFVTGNASGDLKVWKWKTGTEN